MINIIGLEDYKYENIIKIVKDYIIDSLFDNGYSANDVSIIDIKLCGSRINGNSRRYSDLDVILNYTGKIREDDLFSILHENTLYIEDIVVDINPKKVLL